MTDFIKDSSLSMKMGMNRLQSQLLKEIQKLPGNTNLVQVFDALKKASEATVIEIEQWESERVKKYSTEEKAA